MMCLCKLWVGVCVGLLLPSAAVAWGIGDEPPLTFAIHVQDYVTMPGWRWRTAQDEIGRMFGRAGVRVAWRQDVVGHVRDPVLGIPNVTVLILSAAMTERKCAIEGITDVRLATGAKGAGRAWIFYDRIVTEGDLHGVDPGILLARAVAHELGHLIAGLPHSASGIMREYAEAIPGGFQQFLPDQSLAIRRSLQRASASPAPMGALRSQP
jgi:hypothetical protein